MSCFYVSARLRVCSIRALSRLRALFDVGAWCSDPGTHVLSFGFVSGFGHSCSVFCLIVWVCGLEFTQPRSLLFTCVMLCVVAGSSCFLGCVHSCYVLCCVACSLCISLAVCFHVVMSCVNTWLMSILISCVFVSSFAHGWRFVLLAICLCFCFVWAHGFCLSFLCAMCSHVNCLDPTHLVSWFLVNLPHLSSLVTLLVYSLYNLLVFPVLPCQACQLCCFSPTG